MIQDEGEKADPKICFLRRLSSTRSLFSLLILVAMAATSRFSLSLSDAVAAAQPSSAVMDLDLPVFNSTLLKLAESDPGEPRLRQEIQQLIEGNFDKLARFRPFVIWRRFTAAVDIRNRSYATSRANIRSPAFYRIYLRFQTLLSDWSGRRNEISPDSVLDDILPLLGRRKKYSSCAVVGNSGILLNAGRGVEIDSHESVIRLNNARISGFAADVGEKTTISFVNSNILHFCNRRKSCPCFPYGASVTLLLYICQPIHFLDYATCNSTAVSPILVTDPRFDLLCGKIVKYYSLKRWFEDAGNTNRSLAGWTSAHDGMLFHYSSGMQAVMTAAAVCERVSLYGFGKAATAKHHYHTNQKAELHLHDYEAEYDFYRDLMERPYLIPFLPENSGFQFPPLQIYH